MEFELRAGIARGACLLLKAFPALGSWESPRFLLAAGYEGYGYGYGYGQENSGNYGYGVATSNSWDMANSDVDMNPDGSGDVMAKMNQRLDMVPHMEAEAMPGGHYGAGGDR